MSLLEDFAKAIEQGVVASVNSAISSGAVQVDARLPRAQNPPAVVFSARFGRADIVDMLLKAGARLNDVDDRGQTACHAAVTSKHADVLALLHNVVPPRESLAPRKFIQNGRFFIDDSDASS